MASNGLDDSQFAQIVSEEISQLGSERGINNQGDQFAVWFASEILREELNTVIDVYHIGGAGDGKVDIGICDDDHDIRSIIQTKYSTTPMQAVFNEDLIEEVINARERLRISPNIGNRKRREFALAYNQSEKDEQLIAAGFGRFTPEAQRYANQRGVEIYDFDKMKLRYIRLNAPGALVPPERLVFTLNNQVSRETTSSYDMLVFMADAKEVASAVTVYGDALFDENLRYRLVGAAKGRIGKGIEDTIKESPDLLAALNNGITIVSSNFDVSPGFVVATNPQVVNGGQTCWAIHDAIEDLRRAGVLDQISPRLLIRIIKTNNPTLQQKITIGTNTQNPIKPRDMKSQELHQIELASAFDQHAPKVLYEYKEGLLEFRKRMNDATLYRISGRKYRRLSNELAGQLYLALLGVPYKSKADKKLIMGDEAYYRTIFNFESPADERFNNTKIGIRPQDVSLRSGEPRFFVEDVLFAFGLYNLASAVGELYSQKLELYPPAVQLDNPTYASLLNYDFMTGWEYYVVAGVHYVIERIRTSDTDRSRLRELLVGHDISRFWESLQQSFNLNTDIQSYVVLNESNPSTEFPLFGKWITSLSFLLAQQVAQLKTANQWRSTRHFLDLTDASYTNFVLRIEEIVGGPLIQRNQYFPTTM